jgi:hypothetical protein
MRHRRGGGSERFDLQGQSIDLAYDDAFSGGNIYGTDRVPKFAMDKYFSGGG